MPSVMTNLDDASMRELERQARAAGTTVSATASRLLAQALDEESPSPSVWTTAAMRARVDLENKDAVR